MDFETESPVETFQQNTSEVHDDKACRVKACVKKKKQKHLLVWHDAVGSVSPYFRRWYRSCKSPRLLRKEEPESVKAFSEGFLDLRNVMPLSLV